jgi:UDP-N-acetylglucosamine 3-dehydrogenase
MRFGLIGLGMMGRHHARILSESDDVEFVGACDPSGDRHNAMRTGRLFSKVEDLLKEGIDASIIAVPTVHHLEIALQMVEHGVHTLVEKPLAESVSAAEEIRDAFASRGVLQELKRRLEAGELGRVISIATERVGPFPNRIQDVGVVKDLATHDIDIVTWIGGADFSYVSGQLAHKMGRPHEDLVVATGRLANDVVASISVNWLTPVKRRSVSVLGERGSFVADLLSGDLTFYANAEVDSEWDRLAQFKGVSEGDMIRYAFPKKEPLAVEQAAFREAIANGAAEGVVTLDEGVRILEVAEQIIRGES